MCRHVRGILTSPAIENRLLYKGKPSQNPLIFPPPLPLAKFSGDGGRSPRVAREIDHAPGLITLSVAIGADARSRAHVLVSIGQGQSVSIVLDA